MTTMAEPCGKCGKLDANKCLECNPCAATKAAKLTEEIKALVREKPTALTADKGQVGNAEAQRHEHIATVDSLGATRIVWNGAVCKGGLAEGTQLYAEPQDTHALSIMRNAFRVTEMEGDPDPSKQRFHMRFTFRSLEELHKADDQWRAFSKEAK